jgi:hypothetical protein
MIAPVFVPLSARSDAQGPIKPATLLYHCRRMVGNDVDKDKCLQLTQPITFAKVLVAMLDQTVRYNACQAAHCKPDGIWAVGPHQSSKQALILFAQQRVQPAAKQLASDLANQPLGEAFQILDSSLVIDEKFAKNVVAQLALTLTGADDSLQFDRNGALLATSDGQVHDVKQLALRASNRVAPRGIQPGDLIRRALPYTLAGANNGSLEALEALARTVLPDDDGVRKFWLHMLATIAFTPDGTDAHVFVLIGETQSGKTTLIELIVALFGDYAVRVPEPLLYGKTFDKRTADEALGGARIAYVDDPTAPISVELLKRLTNRDGNRCHILIAAQEAQFRAVLSNAEASIGGRVGVITLPKRFVPPHEHCAENQATHPLAKTASELKHVLEAGAPSLMHKLLHGGLLVSCAALYASTRTPLPRCDLVRLDTQRLLEAPTIKMHECVKKWRNEVMRKPTPDTLPLLIRQADASVDVAVLLAHYNAFVEQRSLNRLAVPTKTAVLDNSGDDDKAEGSEPTDASGAANSNGGAARKRTQRSDTHRKRSKIKKTFEFALASELNATVVDKKINGYRWTGEVQQ